MKHSNEWKMRRFLKKTYRKGNKPTSHPSLLDCDRYRYDEDGEGMTEYGFFPINLIVYTDEEISEWIDEHMRMRICSPYDCTGQLFTRWITWHRNPNGRISFVHRLGLDV